jgi:hypothetical protein
MLFQTYCFIFVTLTVLFIAETQLAYKSQLQIYTQKRHKGLPLYHTIQTGTPQASLFRSTVTVDGQTFESPQDYRTVKEAEFSAARVALMSLPQESKPPEKISVGSAYFLLLWMVLICTTSHSL